MYLKKLKIGNVELENNIILAPMAGITDLPFRVICKKFGPALVCTEMVSSKAIFHNDANTKRLMKIEKKERPVSVQIFGSDEESMEVATKYVNEIADIIDINMGCPAPKLVKNGDGAGLLLDLKNVEQIVKKAVEVSSKPITVKTRKGFDKDHITAVDVAKICDENGVSQIVVHGRTREEYYLGKADLEIIKEVKNAVSIPVIGNGDIVDVNSAMHMFEYTGCDGIMIGRGAQGNPWIFKSILEGKDYKPNIDELEQVIMEHIKYQLEFEDEKQANLKLRKHLAWYIKGLDGSAKIRNEINRCENINEVKKVLDEYFNFLRKQ